MKNKRFSIGEVSEIMGISVQTLRYYCNIGLIFPEYIDPHTGYRYFSFNQFHYIDRTRYLMRCGFQLDEIKRVLLENDIDLLTTLLQKKKEEKLQELMDIQETINIIDWYNSYFQTGREQNPPYYTKWLPQRYLIAVKCSNNYTHEEFYTLFNKIKNSVPFQNTSYLRQFVSVLDYDLLLQNQIKRQYVGMFALHVPENVDQHILTIPEGTFYCFRTYFLRKDRDLSQLKIISETHNKPPRIALVIEYETDLQEYTDCPYEMQILF